MSIRGKFGLLFLLFLVGGFIVSRVETPDEIAVYETNRHEIQMYNATTDTEAVLVQSLYGEIPHNPVFSPDGKTVAYHVEYWNGEEVGCDLRTVNVQTKEISVLTNGKFTHRCDHLPTWSPDGKKIAYLSNSLRSNDLMVIATYNLETGDDELLNVLPATMLTGKRLAWHGAEPEIVDADWSDDRAQFIPAEGYQIVGGVKTRHGELQIETDSHYSGYTMKIATRTQTWTVESERLLTNPTLTMNFITVQRETVTPGVFYTFILDAQTGEQKKILLGKNLSWN
jgi:dipeptidyl aminopeptidase/acylaminoacyl peptidase